MQAALDRLARRAVLDSSFLGHQLAAYAARHGLADAGLAEQIGVPVEQLANLRICGRIRIDSPEHVAGDLRSVAEKFGCDMAPLAFAVGKLE
jgi:hypothetical protein